MNPDIINDGGPAKRKRCGGGRAFHSRLEAFVDFIREQRQRRRTWQEIAAVLSNEKGCAITCAGRSSILSAAPSTPGANTLGRNVICVESDHHPNRRRTSTGTKTNFGRNSATARGSPAKSRRHQTQ
jgi:hypothetical protein